MTNKHWTIAIVLLLLIPLVFALNGFMFNPINPESAAGHPDYVRNFHRLTQMRMACFFGCLAVVGVLWVLVCLMVILSKKRSLAWLLLAVFGPFGFAVLATLDRRTPVDTDRYARFVGKMNGWGRAAYELCCFALIWMLGYQAMVLRRMLIILYQAAVTGMSMAQIMDLQNASSGMWAFSEGNAVMYFAVLLYLLRPMAFSAFERILAMARAR